MNNSSIWEWGGTKSGKIIQPQLTQTDYNRPGADPRAGQLRSWLLQAYQRESPCPHCGHLFPPLPVINGHAAPSITRQPATGSAGRPQGPVLICKLAARLVSAGC